MTDPGRFRLATGPLLGILLIAGISIYISFYPLRHTDVWAHAKYGEWYWLHQESPGVEPLSPFSDHSVGFPDVAWLSQVSYHLLYQLGANLAGGDAESQLKGGAEALRSFHLLLLVARFVLLWLALRRLGGSANWATLGVFLYMMAVGLGSAVQRPQAFGLFFFTAIIYALSTPTLSRRAMFWLPLSFVVWANLHGTFMAGLAVLGLYTLGRLIERRAFDPEIRRLIVVGLLCGLGTLLNPHGPWLYRDLFAFSGHPNLKTMTEWLPMRVSLDGGKHWPYLLSLFLLVFVRLLGGRKVGAAGLLVAIPFAIWPWIQGRMILWWWTIAVWILAKLGPGLADRFPTMPKIPDGPPTRSNAWIASIAILATIVFFPPIRSMMGIGSQPVMAVETPWKLGLELTAAPEDEGRWMPDLRQAIRENFPDGRFQGTVFASETQGDFLVWKLPKEIPVLMYTHAHVFSEQHWQDCLMVRGGREGWREFLNANRANLMIVELETHPELVAQLREDPEWQVIQDGQAGEAVIVLIAVRKKPL